MSYKACNRTQRSWHLLLGLPTCPPHNRQKTSFREKSASIPEMSIVTLFCASICGTCEHGKWGQRVDLGLWHHCDFCPILVSHCSNLANRCAQWPLGKAETFLSTGLKWLTHNLEKKGGLWKADGMRHNNMSPSSFFVQVSANMPNIDTAASVGTLHGLELSVNRE